VQVDSKSRDGEVGFSPGQGPWCFAQITGAVQALDF
jgi:hypothetical protein